MNLTEKEIRKLLASPDTTDSLLRAYLQKSLDLIEAEKRIDDLELQLREQYQLVDEKDKEIEQLKGDTKWIKNKKKK